MTSWTSPVTRACAACSVYGSVFDTVALSGTGGPLRSRAPPPLPLPSPPSPPPDPLPPPAGSPVAGPTGPATAQSSFVVGAGAVAVVVDTGTGGRALRRGGRERGGSTRRTGAGPGSARVTGRGTGVGF